jgi:anti-sigma factor RsiW
VTDNHDETLGAYLTGELPPAERDALETHLLTCDRCWNEIDLARRGRALIQQTDEPVPPHLRENILNLVPSSDRPVDPPRRRLRVLATTAALAAVVILTASVVAWVTRPVEPPGEPRPGIPQPAQIVTAVANYHAGRLPGAEIPAQPGPNLTALRLTETGAGTGELAGLPVTGHAYRDDTGRRVLIYLSDRPFTMPADAEHPNGPTGGSITSHQGVSVLCSRAPYRTLVLGDDQRLVRQVAASLDLM